MNSFTQVVETWVNQNGLHGILPMGTLPPDYNLEFDPNREPEQYAEYLDLLPGSL